jgi:hypothetical protein
MEFRNFEAVFLSRRRCCYVFSFCGEERCETVSLSLQTVNYFKNFILPPLSCLTYDNLLCKTYKDFREGMAQRGSALFYSLNGKTKR